MRRRRKTKILATLGPVSSNPESIRALFEAGADAFRINMSHTSHAGLADLHRYVRSLEESAGRPISILVDLQGPKIRLGTLSSGPREVKTGEKLILVRKAVSDNTDIPLPHSEIFAALQPGENILIDDGKVRLKIESVAKDRAEATVMVGGMLKDKKGVNLPDTVLPIPAMTPKDRTDLDAALHLGVDWIALSFVQRPDDVAELKKVIGGRAAALAKIEKPKALEWLPDILDLSDALMVARGDLGVELPVQQVPGQQKYITRAARKAGKPVVVATQMLESMITSPVPTRAEVSDVATAVFEGADAVMLSAESAAGQYPVEAVSMMDQIATTVETDPLYVSIIDSQRTPPESTTADAIMAAVHEVQQTIHARAIVCWTKSGATALRAARERSDAPIIALTPTLEISRRLSLVWGLHCIYTQDAQDLDDMVDRAARFAYQEGFAKVGERIVVTAGVPLRTPGATNMLRVAFVGPQPK
ncbi:MAG: pyruvate kinase [Alphaproteobacteria bacterium]|nr:pyruvate kinase [Alphaproteobacteria bacterium]MDE2164069.1 pyruvate kinase [Alphaproteobacteria bacterium]MDE2266831.1 pyruvate kinase [Alphaproteobacteria bacterium]MDE2500122.1 pyruvate kinase [Alphaproteobacteria bacterium]